MLEIIVAFILLVTIFYWYNKKNEYLPPGPNGIPYIGTIINRERPHKQLTEISEKYGHIFTYYTFGKPVVVLNSYQLIKDLIIKQGEKFSDRPQTDLALKELKGNYGLVFANGHLWKEQRRFALSTLRDFGLGKPILERGITEEVEELVMAIEQETDKPFDIQSLLNKAVSNVISQLTFGKRFEYSDENVFYVLDAWNRILKGTNVTTGLGIKLWMIPFIPGLSQRLKERKEESEVTRNFTLKIIEEHRNDFDEQNEPTDYIYAYLHKQKQTENENNSFSDHQLLLACNQLFAAGTETTATTLRWAILYCSIHPEVQEKVYDEIRQKIGYTLPHVKDRNKLPYTEAFLLETQRCGSLVGITVRQTTQDVEVENFKIPAKTPVVLNYWAVHSNAELFPEPEKFKPERFVDDEGKLKRDENMVPFGAGKRICLGEALAKMELILFFVAMIQKFKFEIPEGDPKPNLEHISGITMQPHSFRVKCTKRMAEAA